MKASVINKIKTSNKLFGYNFVFLMVVLGIFGIVTDNVSALTYSDNVDLNFTFNPSITVSLSSSDIVINDLTPGSIADSNDVTVNVVTNNITGYNLSATVGNNTDSNPSHNTTNLVHSNGTNIFTSLNTNDSLANLTTPNTWGYSYSLDNGTNWSNYSGLPLYSSTGKTLSEKYTPSDDNIDFKIAAYASTTETAGAYTNKINFTAIAFPGPLTLEQSYAYFNKTKTGNYYTMQDMEPGICGIAIENSELQVIDMRDGNTYTIAKINDNCWMTQNLRIDGVIASEYSNFTGEDVNISQGDLDQTAGTCSGADCNSFTVPMTHNSENTSNGVWYNYAAATAGTIIGAHNTTDATEDVCPLGWKLPTSSQQETIFGSDYVSIYKPVRGGEYTAGALVYYSYAGYFWSSTPNASHEGQNRDDLRYSTALHSGENARVSGLYIRCVANNS